MTVFFLRPLVLAVIFSGLVVGQVDVRWHGIIPLSSTRLDVESAAMGIAHNDAGQLIAVEGNVSIKYASEPCTDTGWNVTKGSVLEYTVYPKVTLYHSDLEIRLRGLTFVVDDTGSYYYTDETNGVQFAFDRDRRLTSVRHFPEILGKRKRCDGFPPFSALTDVYRPHDSYKLRDSEDDVGFAADFLSSISKRLDQRGYIFLYFRPGDSYAKKQRVVKRFEQLLVKMQSHVTRRITLQVGGLRDSAECELFLINGAFPAPVPTPKYSSSLKLSARKPSSGKIPKKRSE